MWLFLVCVIVYSYAFHIVGALTPRSSKQAIYHRPNANLVVCFPPPPLNSSAQKRKLPTKHFTPTGRPIHRYPPSTPLPRSPSVPLSPLPNPDSKTHTTDFAHIGVNLSQTTSIFHPLQILTGYRARLDSFTLHELVRYDPGVKYVEHSCYIQQTDFINHRNRSQILAGDAFLPPPLPRKREGLISRAMSKWTVWTVEIKAEVMSYFYWRTFLEGVR